MAVIYILVGTIIASVSGILIADHISLATPLWQVSVFLGSSLLTIGWIVGVEVNGINARKQHTIRFLDSYLNSTQVSEDNYLFDKFLPEEEQLPESLFDLTTHTVIQTVDRRLDHYVYMAVAVAFRDLDEVLVREMVCDSFRRRMKQFTAYIHHQQKKYPDVWKYARDLDARWGSNAFFINLPGIIIFIVISGILYTVIQVRWF